MQYFFLESIEQVFLTNYIYRLEYHRYYFWAPGIRGHLTTTWTKFWLIFVKYPYAGCKKGASNGCKMVIYGVYYNFLWNRRYVPTYFITGSASTQKYMCIKENSDGSTTKTTFNFKRNQGNQCQVEERTKNPNQQEFAKLSVNDCSWVPECYSAGPSKKFSLKFSFRPTISGSRGKF